MEFERDVEQYLVREVERRGGACIKLGQNGWPDRVVLLPSGWCAWCELKRSGGELAPLQQLRIKSLRIMGQRVRVLWSKKDVDTFLQEWLAAQ